MIEALLLDTIHFAYRSDWKRTLIPVVKDLSLSVHAGEAFGFLGHNGAGKTSTIKCILGLCSIRSGSIKIFGHTHLDPNVRRAVGYLPEQSYFYENLTVLESLMAHGILAGMSTVMCRSRINELLELLSLTEKRSQPLRTLSKGLQQRVGFAQSIIHKPQLLILDEPFSGLDPIGRKEFRDIIRTLKKAGTTIFMSSHILNDVESICDRASIMVRGELKGVYDLKQLPQTIERPYEIRVRIDKNEDVVLQNVLRGHNITMTHQSENEHVLTVPDNATGQVVIKKLLEHGVTLRSYEPLGSNLEEIFLELVHGGQRS